MQSLFIISFLKSNKLSFSVIKKKIVLARPIRLVKVCVLGLSCASLNIEARRKFNMLLEFWKQTFTALHCIWYHLAHIYFVIKGKKVMKDKGNNKNITNTKHQYIISDIIYKYPSLSIIGSGDGFPTYKKKISSSDRTSSTKNQRPQLDDTRGRRFDYILLSIQNS